MIVVTVVYVNPLSAMWGKLSSGYQMYLPIFCFCIGVYVKLICVITHVIPRHRLKTGLCLNRPEYLFSVLHLTTLVVFHTVSSFPCPPSSLPQG